MIYIYEFCALDYDWSKMQTVEEYLNKDLDSDFNPDYKIYGLSFLGKHKVNCHSSNHKEFIVDRLTICLDVAKRDLCWDETFTQEPVILHFPHVNESYGFNIGFEWRIYNNGSSYVASPVELPWLKQYNSWTICEDDGKLIEKK